MEIPEGSGDDDSDDNGDDDSIPEVSNHLTSYGRDKCKPVSVYRNLDEAYQRKRGVVQIR